MASNSSVLVDKSLLSKLDRGLHKIETFFALISGLAVFSLVFILLDALGAKIVMPNDPIFDVDTVKELTRSLLQVIIWVPYMLRSKRVKATFIK